MAMSLEIVGINVLYCIFLELCFNDLKNISLVNKYFNKVFNKDNFWIHKIMKEFPKFLRKQPNYLNSKQWYFRLINSGKLYYFHKDVFIAKNVVKSIPLFHDHVLYIDIYDSIYYYGPEYFFEDNPILKYYKSNFLIDKIDNKLWKIHDDIKDIHHNFILKNNGYFYSLENSGVNILSLKLKNIKSIVNRYKNVCLLLDYDKNLIYIDDNKILNIAPSITYAYYYDSGLIYFIDDKGSLYRCKLNKKSFKNIERPRLLSEDDFILDIKILFKSGTKHVCRYFDYIIVIDNSNILWQFPAMKKKYGNETYMFDNNKYIFVTRVGYDLLMIDDKNNLYEDNHYKEPKKLKTMF